MLYFAFEVIIYLFAIIGVIYFVTGILDNYTLRKAGIRCSFVIERVAEADIEYAVRILEGIITRDELYHFVDSIIIPTDVCYDDELVESLAEEFENIKR